jgi:hypothetical protein
MANRSQPSITRNRYSKWPTNDSSPVRQLWRVSSDDEYHAARPAVATAASPRSASGRTEPPVRTPTKLQQLVQNRREGRQKTARQSDVASDEESVEYPGWCSRPGATSAAASQGNNATRMSSLQAPPRVHANSPIDSPHLSPSKQAPSQPRRPLAAARQPAAAAAVSKPPLEMHRQGGVYSTPPAAAKFQSSQHSFHRAASAVLADGWDSSGPSSGEEGGRARAGTGPPPQPGAIQLGSGAAPARRDAALDAASRCSRSAGGRNASAQHAEQAVPSQVRLVQGVSGLHVEHMCRTDQDSTMRKVTGTRGRADRPEACGGGVCWG